MDQQDGCRRASDRRGRRSSFHLPERRTGFDRRRTYPVLGVLRDRDVLLLAVLVAINLMSLADWFFTMYAMSLGAAEGNPVMAELIGTNPLAAAAFKIGITLAVTIGIWVGRRYRLILATSVASASLYTALIAYHLGGLSVIGGL